MTRTRDVVAVVTVLMVSACTISLSLGQTYDVFSCQQQCYSTYRQNYMYYCRWGRVCSATSSLFRQWSDCYNNCSVMFQTTRQPSPSGGFQRCGVSPVGRIVGGTKAAECEYPWTVAVNVGNSFCGGTIVNSDTVVTAAHCVYTTAGGLASPNTIRVKHGSSNQYQTKIAYVSQVNIHPSFNLQYYDYDVAILKLSQPLVFDRCTSAVCLPGVGVDPFASAGCVAAGWGAKAFNMPTSQVDLQKVQLPLVPLSQCQAAYGNSKIISDIKICAGDIQRGGIDSCLGDSGGPLMCLYSGVYYLFGVVSFGRGCAERGTAGVYTRVTHSSINNWIRRNM